MAHDVLGDPTMPNRPSRAIRSARRAFRLVVLLVALIAGSRVARADEAGDAGVSQAAPTSWYGWQTLTSDGSAIALGALAYGADKAGGTSITNVFWTASVATFFVGAPVIHWKHGHVGKGFGSLGLRVGLPLGAFIAGALIGNAACSDSDSENGLVGCPVGVGAFAALAGLVAAPIVDAAVLAREPVTPPATPPIQAALVPSDGGGKLVLAGRF
jgi:hypothetical protein